MANISFSDVTRFTAASAGSGSFVVSAAVTGYQTPLTAGASNFNYHYRAESADLTQWEVGLGAYTSSNTTLTRTPIFNSAGGSSVVAFSGAPQVAFVFLAEDFNATGQIPGTNTNDSANAGNIGEYISATVLSSQAVALTTGVAANITSIALSAGDWDASGMVNTAIGTSNAITGFIAAVSTTSGTMPSAPNNGAYYLSQIIVQIGGNEAANTGTMRVSLTAGTSIYLVTLVNFSSIGSDTCSAYGFLRARRVR